MDTDALRTIDGRYGRLTFFANDVGAVSRSLALYGEWAENELTFIRGFISPGDTVVDVGAYVGTHTLAFARFVGAEGSVLSLEAQAEVFEVLKDNVAANELSNVRLEHAVVADRIGELEIPLVDVSYEDSFGSTSLREVLMPGNRRPLGIPAAHRPRMARVGSVTIDGFSLARCAVVKIDAEGTEELIIRGAAETIRRTSPVVYAECNCIADGLPTLELLRSLGYEVRLHVVDAFDKNNFVGTVENVFGQGREAALVGLKREDASRFDQIKLRPCEMLLRIETADDLALGMLNKPQYSAEILGACAAARSGGDSWLKELDARRAACERMRSDTGRAMAIVAEERARREELAVQAAAAHAQRDEVSVWALVLGQEVGAGRAEAEMLRNAAGAAREEARRALEQRKDALAMAEACLRQARFARDEADRAEASMETLSRDREASLCTAAEREARAVALSDQVECLRGTLDAVYASRSWRVTAPLRSIGKLIRGRLS